MAKTKIILLVEMDWDFSKSELSNNFEDAVITLPTGEEIRNSKDEKISCIMIMDSERSEED